MSQLSLRVVHLWALLPLALVAAFLALAPSSPHDFWWHLKVGELVETQGVPRTNIFAWGVPADTPFVYAAWLADWLAYQLVVLFGPGGPVQARNILGTLAFAAVVVEAQRRSGSWRLAGLAVLLAGAMASNNFGTRPQNWAWLPFVVFVGIAARIAAGQLAARWLLALPLITVFWANAHGSFVLAPVLAWIFVVGAAAEAWLAHDLAARRRVSWLALAALAVSLAPIVNPIGVEIFGYVLRLLTDPSSQRLVVEWQPPNPRAPAGAVFFLAVVLLLAAFGAGPRRPTLTDVLLCCALLWLACSGQRYVVWFGLAAMPILAQCLGRPAPPAAVLGTEPGVRAERLVVGATILAVLVGLVALQPPFKAQLPVPAWYRGLFAAVPGAPLLFTNDTPVAAAEYLRANPAPGRLFNDMAYGSYLIWALGDTTPVFVDTRVELFPLAIWGQYQAISNGEQVDRLISDYNIERVMLDLPRQGGLAAVLAADRANWRREFAQDRTEIYRRIR